MSYTAFLGTHISPPSSASLVIASSSGSLSSGTYGYVLTIANINGETLVSSASTIAVSATQAVTLTLPTYSLYTNAYKVYRTQAGGSVYNLVATVNIPTLSYTDTASDASIVSAPNPPTFDSADSRTQFNGFVRMNDPVVQSFLTGITAAVGGGQANAVKLTNYFNIVTTVATAADSVALPQLSAGFSGMEIKVLNKGANAVAVFPQAGNTLNGASTATSVAVNALTTFIATGNTTWVN